MYLKKKNLDEIVINKKKKKASNSKINGTKAIFCIRNGSFQFHQDYLYIIFIKKIGGVFFFPKKEVVINSNWV